MASRGTPAEEFAARGLQVWWWISRVASTRTQKSIAVVRRRSDSDQGRPTASDGSHGDINSPSHPDQATPDEASETAGPADAGTPGSAGEASNDRLSVEETGRVHQRTFSERLPSGRHTSGRNGSSRTSARTRGSAPRPVSEAWIGVYRVNSRHSTVRCPFCSKPFPGGRIEEHLLSCLTTPPLPYNMDTLSKDSGECSICLDDLLQGETIARLACLCVYHKSCIDSWCKVKACCPEHPFD
ncbi:hypothetical protein COCON_G00137510 [Conger conger]|uniref:RING-type E3 ubiquitin transferase n=1 Tax=Conger conger TaxID=82655 RepID=A0A9Q1DF88_CONCO|nr:hypothetical protein COCON_G00137510 [Conger conger]